MSIRDLWLIDEAELFLALETSPSRGLWRAASREREIGTGRDVVRITAQDGGAETCFEFRGPTVVGLGDADLERERERMTRVADAAHDVIAAIDGHLALRRGQAPAEDTPLVDAVERRGGVELRLFLESSRFAEVCWTIRVHDDRSIHAHADRFETAHVGEARPSFPLELVLNRTEAESHLLGLMEVAIQVRWPDQTANAAGVLDRCEFRSRSGVVAGSVTVHAPRAPGHGHRIALSGFPPTGNAEWKVEGVTLSQLRASMFCGDVRALWSHKGEVAPFYCPDCDQCYAAGEWQVHHNSVTSVDGVCPANHRRRLCTD